MESTKVTFPPCMMPVLNNNIMQSAEPLKLGETLPLQKTCPWGKAPTVESVSFNDVMSEQLATELQREEDVNLTNTEKKFIVDSNLCLLDNSDASITDFDLNNTGSDTSDDFLLAQMLQLEFDKEHDKNLKKEEKILNGTSKISVSLGNYRRLPNTTYSDDEDEDDDVIEQHSKHHWDCIDHANKTLQAVGRSGVSRHNNTTTTKHDLTMCGRKNAGKLMEFPPGIETGDSGGFDMKISNSVYNTLRVHSIHEDRRIHRIHDKKEKATTEKALDEKTCLILYKLVNGEVLDEINGCISTGKEASVYHGFSKPSDESSVSSECALKIFKTTLNEFQNRDQYIKDDYRFRDRFSRQNPRKTIHMWAEKEMRNLIRISRANIPCPEVITLKKHVLVMSFIGNNSVPALKLKEVKFSTCDAEIAYQQTIEIMKTLYSKCELVHADLSEYNLLWYEDKVWVIDVSQAVEKTHPQSLEFLMRDCHNVCEFFKKLGVNNVMKSDALFTEICGYIQTY